MKLKDEVLGILSSSRGEYVSGEELAHITGKSRAGVWKAIKALQDEGYSISAITNRGYCFDEGNDVLSVEEIKRHLDFDCDVRVYNTIDSTNTEAKRLIAQGNNDTMLITSEEQTAGRGRQGKSFYSPAKTGIYMTLVVHPMVELGNAVTTTTAASVAVCKAVERLTDKVPQIKWVNDVYVDDKKICGILTEAVTDFETQTVTSVIIGIGANISTSDFPDDIENASSLNANVKRAELISAIANELKNILDGDYNSFIDYYRSHSIIIGKDIVCIKNGNSVFARAMGIDDKGGLEIMLEDGSTQVLRSGEVTIRRR